MTSRDAQRPEQGWFATANQMNLPKDYPSALRQKRPFPQGRD
jgi:hypothetical protein